MAIVRCLSCDAENDAVATAGYCERCGRKLPQAAWARTPRGIVVGSAVGPAEEEVPRPGQATANLLFGVAALQLVGGGLLLVLGPLVSREKVTTDFLPGVIAFSVVLLGLFAGLGWWALRQPRPAALTGLVLYVLLAAADVVLFPALALPGLPVKVVLLALLVQAVRTARHT
jgi:hypothetical protein